MGLAGAGIGFEPLFGGATGPLLSGFSGSLGLGSC